jgi:hypothetical protein
VRRLLRFVKSLTGPTMEALALSSICYVGFRSLGGGPRDGDAHVMFTVWFPLAVGCLLASHDVRNFK